MDRFDYHAEEVSEYGGITGDGLGNLLGAPELEPLELLIREAVQNSWDARLRGGEPDVVFGLDYSLVEGDQLDALRRMMFHTRPPSVTRESLRGPLGVLHVQDHGTRGLAGPTHPRQASTEIRDFVNFVYMIGETKDQQDHANAAPGGSYGYGRSAFFRASSVHCVMVYSRVEEGGRLRSRLIGIGWVDRYTRQGVHYTGRHWWGRRQDGWVGPVEDEEADRMAAALGIPVPPPGRTGTTVTVIDPELPDQDDENEAGHPTVIDVVRSSIVWNCWPRMLAGGLKFELRWKGAVVPPPEPTDFPRLRPFVRAFDVHRGVKEASRMARKDAIMLQRPVQKLGELSLARAAFAQGGDDSPGSSAPVSSEEPLQHIALMRNTLLVVRYLRTRTKPQDGTEYAGVFVTDRTADEVFSRSEPPSHDDWVKERLSSRTERSYINVAFRRIEECTREFIMPVTGPVEQQHASSMAALADRLGRLLPGLEEMAAPGHTGPRRSGGGGVRRPSPRLTWGERQREARGDHLMLVLPFQLKHLPGSAGSVLDLQVEVEIAGGKTEAEPPVDRTGPVIESWWLGDDRETLHTSAVEAPSVKLRIPSKVGGGGFVVRQPSDCTIAIRGSAHELQGA